MRIILFDIDGTLINSDGAGRRSIARAFNDCYGLESDLHDIEFHGRADNGILRDVFETKLGKSPSEDELEKILENLVRHLPEELQRSENYRLLDGVAEILEELSRRKDVILGLETGNTEPAAELKLSHGGIWGYFRCGGYGSDSDIRSEIVRHGIRKAESLLEPGQSVEAVWVVGDTPADIEAGKAVGVHVLATATGMHSLDLLCTCGPDVALPDLSNVPQVLQILLEDS
ncbi:MAG TPA: HAD family hydrolase [bacterium]|nr:HAD family hydrolase [bacterium]HQO34419.1 HAD family hydrolase [bacterium]HQP97221.1 HAD family hydrolase [bacterium]